MLLTCWQNKVRRYNTKPLAKEDNVHGYLIAIIEEQRERVVRQHGKATKYLFPTSPAVRNPTWIELHPGFPEEALRAARHSR